MALSRCAILSTEPALILAQELPSSLSPPTPRSQALGLLGLLSRVGRKALQMGHECLNAFNGTF